MWSRSVAVVHQVQVLAGAAQQLALLAMRACWHCYGKGCTMPMHLISCSATTTHVVKAAATFFMESCCFKVHVLKTLASQTTQNLP
eukprot:scaffold169720_cov17-Tisochrysis_lutea.AAC.1